MTSAQMPPLIARMALRQLGLSEVLGLLAYAEGFGLVIGSLGVAAEPTRLVGEAGADVLDGVAPWAPLECTLPTHLRAVLRSRLADRLRREALARGHDGRPLRELRMAVAQLGDLSGVAELAHAAGELMVFVRSGDEASLRAAILVCDRLRARLDQLAALDGGDDTAPIVVAPSPPRSPLPLPPPPLVAGTVTTAVTDERGGKATCPQAIGDDRTPRERKLAPDARQPRGR